MDYVDGIRICALASVLYPDDEDQIHEVFEWYSREYHTPLHVVQDLPLDSVLFCYFRAVYRNMNPEDRHNHAIWLMETPEERQKRADSDKNEEDDFLRQAREANKKKGNKADAAMQAFQRMKEKSLKKQDDLPAPPPPQAPPQNESPKGQEAQGEEEVTVRYVSSGDFEAELDMPKKLPPRKPVT